MQAFKTCESAPSIALRFWCFAGFYHGVAEHHDHIASNESWWIEQCRMAGCSQAMIQACWAVAMQKPDCVGHLDLHSVCFSVALLPSYLPSLPRSSWNRIVLLVCLIASIRACVYSDFPLACRMWPCDAPFAPFPEMCYKMMFTARYLWGQTGREDHLACSLARPPELVSPCDDCHVMTDGR